jgi:hypothetical protein
MPVGDSRSGYLERDARNRSYVRWAACLLAWRRGILLGMGGATVPTGSGPQERKYFVVSRYNAAQYHYSIQIACFLEYGGGPWPTP